MKYFVWNTGKAKWLVDGQWTNTVLYAVPVDFMEAVSLVEEYTIDGRCFIQLVPVPD